jgi:hypothetical protein
MLSITGNDSNLFAVLPEGIELVCESGLELLAGDVGQLGFGDERFCLSADELLFEDNNLR